jgi:hypothetical protein
MTVRFCSQCGTKTAPDARFCASCGTALAGSGQKTPSWRTQLPDYGVSVVLLIGTGLWFAVLRTQPFLTVGSSADGPATGGGQELPQNHPPSNFRKRFTNASPSSPIRQNKSLKTSPPGNHSRRCSSGLADRGELSQCRARIVQACSRACAERPRRTQRHGEYLLRIRRAPESDRVL